MDFDDVEEPKLDFEEADHRYAQLKGLHEVGMLTDREFDEKLRHLMVQDDEGHWWSKSLKGGEWHYYDGHTWIRGIPPGLQPTAQERLPSEERVPDDQPQIEQRVRWRQKEVLAL